MSKHAAVPAAQLWRGLSLLHSSIQHLRLTETWNRHTSTYLNISFPDDRYLHHIIIPCKDSHLICPLVLQTFLYLFCDRCKCTIIKNTVCHCIVITLYFILHWTQCLFFKKKTCFLLSPCSFRHAHSTFKLCLDCHAEWQLTVEHFVAHRWTEILCFAFPNTDNNA